MLFQNPLKLWEREKHHDVLLEYYKLKISYYNNILKLKEEHLSIQDRRTALKLEKELQQNIINFQTANKYYLELFTANRI